MACPFGLHPCGGCQRKTERKPSIFGGNPPTTQTHPNGFVSKPHPPSSPLPDQAAEVGKRKPVSCPRFRRPVESNAQGDLEPFAISFPHEDFGLVVWIDRGGGNLMYPLYKNQGSEWQWKGYLRTRGHHGGNPILRISIFQDTPILCSPKGLVPKPK